MPKRIGFLYEKIISEENCIAAERQMAKNKPDNQMAKHIGANAEKYGKELSEMLAAGAWVPRPNRETVIQDSYKKKERRLKVPCLQDQAVQYAWLNIATPHIEKKNYYYNCGSIPGAGQTRAVKFLQKALGAKKPPKYGGVFDIRKFYDTCPHWAVMKGLRRIFKDERFLHYGELILNSMSSTGIGLAIGHPASHWFANVALMAIDHGLRRNFPDVKLTRYMDDVVLVSNNKRHIRKAMQWLISQIRALGMEVKHTWQIFQIKKRGITFLSYRFFPGYTILAKRLMYRISRKFEKAHRHGVRTAHTAAGLVSYMGILSHCNSFNFRKEYVYPKVSIKKCKEVISNAAKNTLCLSPGGLRDSARGKWGGPYPVPF